jgi:hypothetical protein
MAIISETDGRWLTHGSTVATDCFGSESRRRSLHHLPSELDRGLNAFEDVADANRFDAATFPDYSHLQPRELYLVGV